MSTENLEIIPPLPELIVKQYPIDDLLGLEGEDLANCIKESCEITIDGAMSEWGSKVDELFRKIEKSVLSWHQEGVTQRVTLVFVEKPTTGTVLV